MKNVSQTRQLIKKQCTIKWHVDDLNISHVDKKVVDKLNEKIGEHSPLTISRGKN